MINEKTTLREGIFHFMLIYIYFHSIDVCDFKNYKQESGVHFTEVPSQYHRHFGLSVENVLAIPNSHIRQYLHMFVQAYK